MKRKFLTMLILVAALLVAILGATGVYGATTDDYLRVDGIDVSQWNGNVDWHKAKADGMEYVFLRVGGRGYGEKGVLYFDDNLKTYYDGAKDANIMVGGYFFSQAVTVEEAVEEAEYVHNRILEWGIDPSGFDLPIFVDREFSGDAEDLGRLTLANLSIEDEVQIELAFCNKMRELGYESGLYSYLSFLNDNTDSTLLSQQGYPVWVAQYNDQCDYEYPYNLWQFTDSGEVAGLDGLVDRDYWYLNKSLDANPESNFVLDRCSIELTSVPLYSGSPITPTFTVKNEQSALIENIDYKVIGYLDNVELGTGYAIIRGLGEYTGYRAVPFEIVTKLVAPKNIKVTTIASSGKPIVSWDPVDGANKYEVYRAVGSNGTYQKYYTTTATSMVNTSTTPGVIYYYKVKAICEANSGGNSALSDKVYMACDLPQPKNVKVSTIASSGKPIVSWDPVEGASKYEVYRAVGSNGTYQKYYTTTSTSMVNTSTTPGVIYYYKVKAICEANSGGNSALSDKVYIACDLPQPKNVKVSPVVETGKPKVTWNAVEGASKYEVYRAVGSNGTYQKYYTTTATSMVNTSTTPGVIYYYKVKAICEANSGGNSALSDKVYIACDLAQPKNVKVSPVVETGKPKVTWNAVEGASKYEVYRAVGSNGTYKKYYTTTATSMVNTSTTPGVIYYYKVKAICGTNSGGNSALSDKVYMACDLAQPKASITLTSSGKPKLSWKAVSGASKYEVYRAVGPYGTYEKYYTTTSLYMTNTSAKKGTTYFYKIKAICGSNSGGNSALSNKVYVTSK